MNAVSRARFVAAVLTTGALSVALPALAAQRGTFVMNSTKERVTVIFRAESRATIEDLDAGAKRVITWDDYGKKNLRIEIIGCGRVKSIPYTLSTMHSVLHLSGDCSPYLAPGSN